MRRTDTYVCFNIDEQGKKTLVGYVLEDELEFFIQEKSKTHPLVEYLEESIFEAMYPKVLNIFKSRYWSNYLLVKLLSEFKFNFQFIQLRVNSLETDFFTVVRHGEERLTLHFNTSQGTSPEIYTEFSLYLQKHLGSIFELTSGVSYSIVSNKVVLGTRRGLKHINNN